MIIYFLIASLIGNFLLKLSYDPIMNYFILVEDFIIILYDLSKI